MEKAQCKKGWWTETNNTPHFEAHESQYSLSRGFSTQNTYQVLKLPSRLALCSPHPYIIKTHIQNKKVRVKRLLLQRQELNTFPKLGLIYTRCYAHLQSALIAPDALFSLEGGRSCLIYILWRRWHDFCMWNTEQWQKDYFCWKVFSYTRYSAFHSFFCGTCSSDSLPISLFERTL